MKIAESIQEKDKTIAQLKEQLSSALQQLDWFKRQLFGRKSEKQLIENPQQPSLFSGTGSSPRDCSAHLRR